MLESKLLPRWYTGLFLGNLFGFLAAGIGSIVIIVIDAESWTGDFWTWRNPVSIQETAGHHAFIEFLLIGTLWYFVAKRAWGQPFKAMFLEKRGFLDACLNLFFLMGVHETLYYPFYIARYGVNPLMIPVPISEVPFLRDFWIVVGPGAIAIFVLWKLYLWKDSPKYPRFYWEFFFGVEIAWFYLASLIFGFPITLDYGGVTRWFASPWVNLVEIFGWGWTCFWWAYLSRKGSQ